MTKILSTKRLLSLTFLLMSVVLWSSCKKDNDVNTTEVVLQSFGPTGAMHGDTLSFIGLNLNKVTDVSFTGITVPQAAFISQTSELIKVRVPKEAERGFVTLKTPQGDIVSKTRLNLEVVPTFATITGQARPGQNITITGEYLNWITSITFADGKVVDSFVSKAINQLVVTVPMDAQTGPLMISYSGTEPMQVETVDTINVILPMITSVSPNPILHATDLTINGTDLDLTKQILFTGVSMPVTTFVSQSATQIVVKVPASASMGKITLVAASGVSTQSTQELGVVLPTLTSLAPNPVDPGANMTLVGTNLDVVSSVTFSNAPAVTTFVSQSATQIVVKVPMGVLRGKVVLGVMNSTLTVQSPDVLEIIGDVPAPTIALPFYKDAVTSNWNGWIGGGWGGTKDFDNTTPVREGTKSIKINYEGGYGSPVQLGGANVDITPYTTFKISIYGAPGSGGKRVNIGVNGADAYTITVVEGKWTDYSVPLSTLTTTSKISELLVKEFNGSGGFTIFVDAMGLN